MNAAGILLVRDDGAVLLARRSQCVSDPGYWSIPGGRAESGEGAVETALREFSEEMGSVPPLQLVSAHPARIPKGIYTTVIATISDRNAACWCLRTLPSGRRTGTRARFTAGTSSRHATRRNGHGWVRYCVGCCGDGVSWQALVSGGSRE